MLDKESVETSDEAENSLKYISKRYIKRKTIIFQVLDRDKIISKLKKMR